jgi:hypothetical protein
MIQPVRGSAGCRLSVRCTWAVGVGECGVRSEGEGEGGAVRRGGGLLYTLYTCPMPYVISAVALCGPCRKSELHHETKRETKLGGLKPKPLCIAASR